MIYQLMPALYCAIVGYVYSVLLVEPGGVLDWWKLWLNKKLLPKKWLGVVEEGPHLVDHEIKILWTNISYQRKVFNWEKLYSALLGCSKCVSGQIALWTYLVTSSVFSIEIEVLILRICAAVLFAQLINSINVWLNSQK